MTSIYDPLFQSITDGVAADDMLTELFADGVAWLDWNLPPSPDQEAAGLTYPCVRVNIINSANTRAGESRVGISFVARTAGGTDETDAFMAQAHAIQQVLNNAPNIIAPSGFQNFPDISTGINRAFWAVRFIAGHS